MMTTPSSDTRAANRAAFPVAAATLDVFREVFGAGCKLRWAREGGREIGKRDKRKGVVPVLMPVVEQQAAEFSARKNGRAPAEPKKGRRRK